MTYREGFYGDEAWLLSSSSPDDVEGYGQDGWEWHRRLDEKEEKASGYRMDYSVLSVAVMTLGLIMVVEFLIHNLDHAAHGKPYFTAVLENIYSELAILGLVEFCVFLMQEYYEDYNKEKKAVFAAVHFALFYTALLNAFQSIILAFAVGRVSRRLWVRTEALELNHYVEIREEFDRVSADLDRLKMGNRKRNSSNSSTSGSDDGREGGNAARWNDSANLDGGIRGFFQAVLDRIRYPQLKNRYDELLVQVRFHELRVHFLKAYNLPLKLKISDYLLRSEQHVLIKLVHVTNTAWLLLTTCINLLYFVLGIVGTKTGDPGFVGETMIFIFFFCMTIFIVLALFLHQKVKDIFTKIMHRRELWQVQEDAEEKERLAGQQIGLFWLNSPKLVITAIQFMQFGYAVALATVIMFWRQIEDGGLGMQWYWLAIIVCYSLFVSVAAHVIPRYTLCTSLGQLVDKKRLSESVAVFHLEEARRQRREEIFLREHQDPTLRIAPAPAPLLLTKHESDGSSWHSTDASAPGLPPNDSAPSIADLVSVDTDSLRANLQESERDALATRLANRRGRRKRLKAVSDGVALMSSLGKGESVFNPTGALPFVKAVTAGARAKDDSEVDSKHEDVSGSEPSASSHSQPEPLKKDDTSRQSLIERSRSKRGRMKTLSDGVSLMAALKDEDVGMRPTRSRLSLVREDSERIADMVFMKTDSLRDSLRSSDLQKIAERDSRGCSRKKSKKSNSDGVSDMRDVFDHNEKAMRLLGRRRKASSDGVKTMSALTLPTSGSESSEAQSDAKHAKMESKSPAVTDGISNELIELEEELDDTFNEKNLDDASIRSLASDYHSDFNDVPGVDPTMLKSMTVQVEHPNKTARESVRDYFLSKRYPIMSNVFGTMVAFFLVGSRIERFLHTENIVSDEWISFDLHETVTFWAFTVYLSLFLMMDVAVFVSLGPYHTLHALRARKVWVSALLDTIICSVCLTVFYLAEHNRCCNPSDDQDYRFLAEYVSYGSDSVAKSRPRAPCACPPFGSRVYGGLGKIEPFASLVSLRLIRFWLASRIVKYLDKKRGTAITKQEARALAADNENLDPFDVASDAAKPNNICNHDHGNHDDHGHGHHGEERGTIAELWEAAVSRHPEIVAKYGDFSGELLQVMLGIPIIDSPSVPLTPAIPSDGGDDYVPSSHRESFFIDDQYSNLPSGAQEIIMAGKLGKTVVSVPDHPMRESTFTIPEHADGDGMQENHPLRFEVASDPVMQELNLSVSAFDVPNARLVRSMRRCERKLHPILSHWTVVDVVITRFEIVYFDVVGVDDDCPNTSAFEALAATKGGKGLRLCDVASSRRVVGRLSISDITSVNVEREMPTEDAPDEIDAPATETVRKTEYWQQKADSVSFYRREFWHKIKQDRLVANTTHGHTLYLRFYADLEDAQNHPEHYSAENEYEGDIYKDNAFQWAQTISRMCGPEQLKQALPHFGDDTNEELRDYLVVHRQDAEPKGHRRALSRGFGSSARLDALAVHAAPNRPGPARRASSFGDSLFASFSTRSGHPRAVTPPRGRLFGRSSTVEMEQDVENEASSSRSFRRPVSAGADAEASSSPALLDTEEEERKAHQTDDDALIV